MEDEEILARMENCEHKEKMWIPDSLAEMCEECGKVWVAGKEWDYKTGNIIEWVKDLAEK